MWRYGRILCFMTKQELRKAASLLGRRGGFATARKLTPEQRKQSSQRALEARWARQRERKAQEATV